MVFVCHQKQEEQKPGIEPTDMDGETLIAMVTKAVTAIMGRLQSELLLYIRGVFGCFLLLLLFVFFCLFVCFRGEGPLQDFLFAFQLTDRGSSFRCWDNQ